MRILLVDPPGKNKGLNTGLGYLSAVLMKKHEVRVLDLNNMKLGLCGDPNPDMPMLQLKQRIEAAVSDFEPELFGVSVKSFTAHAAGSIFQFARTLRPQMTTIAGGPHITLEGAGYIEENAIDFGVHQEGEHTTVELCDALEGQGDVENIAGIYFRHGEQVVLNPPGGAIKDLDKLHLPNYDNFSSVVANGGRLQEYPLLTSRGCPFRCSYCSMPKIMGRVWRWHSPARVIEELELAREKYRCTSFTVIDDNFTLNLKRVDEICDLLINEKIGLKWSSQNGIRADKISRELAEKMSRSGCTYVWIGIESVDERVFQSVNKGEELSNIITGIRLLKGAGIRVGGFFIVGLPHSTRESDLKSVDFVREHHIDGWWFNFVPYPHTEAWEWVQSYGRVLRPVEGALQYGGDTIEPVFETDEYTKEERIKTYVDIHIRGRWFDRLAEPSARFRDKWGAVYKQVRLAGPGAVLSFLVFIPQYYARAIMRRLPG